MNMVGQAMEAKRRGRPPKNPEDRKAGNLTFRVRDGMRDRLEAASGVAGRSISEEVERRVEDSLNREQHTGPEARAMGDLVAITLRTIEQRLGRPWHADKAAASYCFDRLKAALGEAMAVNIEPPGNLLEMAAEPDVTAARALAAADNRAQPTPTLSDDARAPWEAKPVPDGLRPATPDEVAAMVPARGQIPPSIGDRALFDDAVSGLPLVQAEKVAAAKRRQKEPLDVGAGSPDAPPAPTHRKRTRAGT